MPRADGDLHAARILLPASLAVLEAFKLEGRLVVPAAFGGPMQSKFRIFVGSVFLFALPAFGQASEPTPAAATAAPGVELEGSSGALTYDFRHNQIGDGIYAIRLSDPKKNIPWTSVGFVRVVNNTQGTCDMAEWVLSNSAMGRIGSEAKLPFPNGTTVRLELIGNTVFLDLANAYIRTQDGQYLRRDDFKKFRVVSAFASVDAPSGKLAEVINVPVDESCR